MLINILLAFIRLETKVDEQENFRSLAKSPCENRE